MAFVALTAEGELAGVSRMVCDPDHRTAEYALTVRSDLAGQGLGTALMTLLVDYAGADGLERLEGPVLRENHGMLALVTRLGFHSAAEEEDPAVVRTWLDLPPAAGALADGPGRT
jgi:acetyltransferase